MNDRRLRKEEERNERRLRKEEEKEGAEKELLSVPNRSIPYIHTGLKISLYISGLLWNSN